MPTCGVMQASPELLDAVGVGAGVVLRAGLVERPGRAQCAPVVARQLPQRDRCLSAQLRAAVRERAHLACREAG